MSGPVRVTFEDSGQLGWDALRFVHRLLVIDEPWTQWHADGFSWWAHSLEQRFRWEGPIDIDELPTWFLSVETDFLRGVTDQEAGQAFVNRWNERLEFGVGALVLEGERVRLRSRTYAMPESAEERARLVASWGIIANAVASQLARLHADTPEQLVELGIDPAWVSDASTHPESGVRDEPDEMLTVVGAVYRPEGREPASEAIDLGLDQAVHHFLATGNEAVGGEFARTVLVQWLARCGACTWRLERAFEHPTLGYGVRSRLVIDLEGEALAPSRALAARLNALEVAAAAPLIGGGAWAVTDEGGQLRLVHTMFSPNAELRARWAPMLAGNAWFRTRWVADALAAATVDGAA